MILHNVHRLFRQCRGSKQLQPEDAKTLRGTTVNDNSLWVNLFTFHISALDKNVIVIIKIQSYANNAKQINYFIYFVGIRWLFQSLKSYFYKWSSVVGKCCKPEFEKWLCKAVSVKVTMLGYIPEQRFMLREPKHDPALINETYPFKSTSLSDRLDAKTLLSIWCFLWHFHS